jgi:hypothetical protein
VPLKELAESDLAIIAVEDAHPFQTGFPVMYVTANNVRSEINRWLKGAGEIDIMHKVIKKCGYTGTLYVIANACKELGDAKWTRAMQLLCLLDAAKFDVASFSDDFEEIYDSVLWHDGTDDLLDKDLQQLTVHQVMQLLYKYHARLVEAPVGVAPYRLCLDLRMSYEQLERCEDFEFAPLRRLCKDTKDVRMN